MKRIILMVSVIVTLGAIIHICFISENLVSDYVLSFPAMQTLVPRLAKDQPQRLQQASLQKGPEELIVGIHFKDGSTMVGKLLNETRDEYIIEYKGREFAVYKKLVASVNRRKEALEEKGLLSEQQKIEYWPYSNPIVVKRTNATILDGIIVQADNDKILLRYDIEGSGYIEEEISSKEIEHLIFRPVQNNKSRGIEVFLKEQFPEMDIHRYGSFTILSDSYITWVKEYLKTLRIVHTEIYFRFFDLFRDKRPLTQNFVVIFDNRDDYIDNAQSMQEGLGRRAAGYFVSNQHTLYLCNTLGKEFSEELYDKTIRKREEQVNMLLEKARAGEDRSYEADVRKWGEDSKKRHWEDYSYRKGFYRRAMLSTLRHEFSHETFHNWGIQNLSDTNPWYAEGIATYCETDPVGIQNNRLLAIFQENQRKGSSQSLVSLILHETSGFADLSKEMRNAGYGQSWAFITFLIKEYPLQFMDFQKKMIGKRARGEGHLFLLMNVLGKDARAIEAEFIKFMQQYEEVDSAIVEHVERMNEIFGT